MNNSGAVFFQSLGYELYWCFTLGNPSSNGACIEGKKQQFRYGRSCAYENVVRIIKKQNKTTEMFVIRIYLHRKHFSGKKTATWRVKEMREILPGFSPHIPPEHRDVVNGGL